MFADAQLAVEKQSLLECPNLLSALRPVAYAWETEVRELWQWCVAGADFDAREMAAGDTGRSTEHLLRSVEKLHSATRTEFTEPARD
jgi:hypothetical protein